MTRIWSDTDGWIEAEVQSVGSSPVTSAEGWVMKRNALLDEADQGIWHLRKPENRTRTTKPCFRRCGRIAENRRLLCGWCRKQKDKAKQEAA